MFNPKRGYLLVPFFLILCACSEDSNDDSSAAPGTDENPASTGGGGTEAVASNEPTEAVSAKCGNKIPEPTIGEECDDGNMNDTDGCTSLCEYSCHSDSDCQKDECAGSDSICDSEFHFCTPGTGAKPDDEPCGTDGSCRGGVCVEHACNNGYEDPGEECDDGDTDDSNGCTIECKYSCVTGDDGYPSCDNPCDLTAVCDDSTHSCVAGDPLPDDAICSGGDGYCSNGDCILSVCGDGLVQPNEECDPSAPGAGPDCQSNCTLGICGNGVIEGKEQCDDSNTTKLDGCDNNCKIEMITVPATFFMTAEESPDYCVFQGNAMGEWMQKAMESMMEAMQSDDMQETVETVEEEVPDEVTEEMEDMEPVVPLIHVLDIDDPMMKTVDPLINLGMGMGTPPPDAVGSDGKNYSNTSDSLDFPILLYREFYNDELNPLTYGQAEVKIENGVPVVYSLEPLAMGMKRGEGELTEQRDLLLLIGRLFGVDIDQVIEDISNVEFVLRNIMLRMEIDEGRSKLPPPPETATDVFESAGNYDPTYIEDIQAAMLGTISSEDSEDGESSVNPFENIDPTKRPTGVVCATLDEKIFDTIGLPYFNMILLNINPYTMCPNEADQLTWCQSGMSPKNGDCDSVLDLLKIGCSGGLIELPPLGEPDADTDGDGINDSYTIVIRLSVRRLKLAGDFAEGASMMAPVIVEH